MRSKNLCKTGIFVNAERHINDSCGCELCRTSRYAIGCKVFGRRNDGVDYIGRDVGARVEHVNEQERSRGYESMRAS